MNPLKVSVKPVGPKTFYVEVLTEGLDRNDVAAWELPSLALAYRLKRAIDAGKVLKVLGVEKGIGGTYLSVESLVLARTLNADLKKMGF